MKVDFRLKDKSKQKAIDERWSKMKRVEGKPGPGLIGQEEKPVENDGSLLATLTAIRGRLAGEPMRESEIKQMQEFKGLGSLSPDEIYQLGKQRWANRRDEDDLPFDEDEIDEMDDAGKKAMDRLYMESGIMEPMP